MMNGGRDHQILLVDDEEIFLSSLSEGLRRRFPEMTFRTARDGQAALEALGQHAADLVITDLKMPRMDGFQLIAAMHSRYPSVPLLIMTAHSTELSEGKVMSAGALHCIDKPVDLAELARRIDELFSTGAIASLRGVSLAAFLQLLGLERKSGIVDVRGGTTRARLYLRGGQIIHAEDETQSGLQAALRAVSLDDVEIHFRPGAVPKVPTIDLPLTQILLDSARMRDESERAGGGGGGGGDNFDLAFSESFDGLDEQLSGLEMKDDDGAPRPRQVSTRLARASTSQIAAPLEAPPAAPMAAAVPVPAPKLPVAAQPLSTHLPQPQPQPPPSAAQSHMTTALPVPLPPRAGSSTAPMVSRAGFTVLPNRTRPPTTPQAMMPHSVEANVSDAVATCLRKIGEISGVLGAAFIDFHSGEALGSVTRDASFDTLAAARANIEVVRTKLALIHRLGLHDHIQDVVITTRLYYHVLCLSERRPRQFVFVALARDHATLALSRFLIDEAIDAASAGLAPTSPSSPAGPSSGGGSGASTPLTASARA
jgi:CheY-like chemotaxis protein